MAEDLAAALQATLARAQGAPGTVEGLHRLSAGATQQTWSFDWVRGAGREPLILRRAPGTHRSPRVLPLPTEAALIAALAGSGVPLPRVVQVLQPDDGLGEGFVMSRIDGETIARKIQRDAAFDTVRPQLVTQFGRALAAVHAAEVSRLPALPTCATAATLAQLQAEHDALARPSAVFAFALRWLQQHQPPDPPRPVLVHGDYRLGNLMVHPADGLRAVLDWELAHVGDPAADLAWITLPPWRFGQIDRAVGGLGPREAFWAAYEAAGGPAVDPARVRWWQALGSLRWGLMCAGMRAWFASGRDRGMERATIARRTSESELDLLRLLTTEDPHA